MIQPPIKREIRKILLIRNDKIGDMVVSSNVFRELKELPKAKITVIASTSNKPLIEKNKNIDKIIELDYPPRNFKSICSYLKIARQVKKEKYDVGIDLRGSFVNVFLIFVLGKVKYKIGFYNRLASKMFLDYAYKKDRKNMHSTQHRIDLINKSLGMTATDYWPDIATNSEDEKEFEKIRKTNKLKKYICIVPDASLEKKQWLLENFDTIIKYLNANYPKHQITIIGSDEKKIKWLADRNKSAISFVNLNLRQLYFLLKKSSLVIAHDGGPMHLAWAAKANLIALMSGHLGIKYIGPLGENSRVLVSAPDNINSIKLEEVQKEIRELLNDK